MADLPDMVLYPLQCVTFIIIIIFSLISRHNYLFPITKHIILKLFSLTSRAHIYFSALSKLISHYHPVCPHFQHRVNMLKVTEKINLCFPVFKPLNPQWLPSCLSALPGIDSLSVCQFTTITYTRNKPNIADQTWCPHIHSFVLFQVLKYWVYALIFSKFDLIN